MLACLIISLLGVYKQHTLLLLGDPDATRPPILRKPNKDANYWHMRETMFKHHKIEQKARMMNRVDEPQNPRPRMVRSCQG